MAFSVRRIVTGDDSSGKAIVATDEELAGAASPSRPGISRCEVWSADKMPVDNSEGAAARGTAQGLCRAPQLCRLGPGQCLPHRRVLAGRHAVHAPHRDAGLRDPVEGRVRPRARRRQAGAHEAGRHLRAARHDACLGDNGPEPAVFAFVLIDADPVEMGGKKLTTDLPDTVGRRRLRHPPSPRGGSILSAGELDRGAFLTRRARPSASQLVRRTQPCDWVLPTFSGSGVPWMP